MKRNRCARVASAATAILLLGACGDGDDSSSTTTEAAAGGQTTLAKGEDIALVGDAHSGLGSQTLNIDAVEENGEVTGEFRLTDNVFRVECANTDTDGIVIIGGAPTEGPDFHDLNALIIREGDPDSVALVPNDATIGAKSCDELLEAIPEDPVAGHESDFVDVEDGHDIEIG